MRFGKTVRKWTYLTHLWVGIILSLYFSMLGLTGGLLLFKPELHRIFEARLHSIAVPAGKQNVALDTMAQTFKVVTHGAKISSIMLPATENEPVVFQYRPVEFPGGKKRDWRQCYFNPYTGSIMADEVIGGQTFRTIRNLHANLLLRDLGKTLNGCGALCIFVLLVSGIWLWFPTPKFFKQQFKQRTTIRAGASFNRLNLDIHNAVGFYSSLFLLMFAVTAMSVLWYDQAVSVVSVLTGTPLDAFKMKESAEVAEFSYDKVLRTAKDAVPGYLPAIITDTERVMMAKPESHLLWPTLVTVSINKDSGAIENIETIDMLPLGRQVMTWMMPIHFGQWGFGALYYPVKLIWFAAGLCPLILSITGINMYLQKRKTAQIAREKRAERTNTSLHETPVQ